MAKTTKQETKTVVTRAEKKDAAKNIIKELLALKPHKHNELIETAAKLYAERLGSEGNINDINGRIGSVLDIMKKESEVAYEGGMYALKARLPMPEPAPVAERADEPKAEEKPKKKTARTRAKKTETTEEKAAPVKDETQKIKEEKPKKTTRKGKANAVKDEPAKETNEPEKTLPLPPSPLQPIAPVVPVTPEVAPEPIPEQIEEMPTPKKRGRKPKAKAEEVKTQPQESKEEKQEEKAAAPQEKPAEKPVEKAVETPVGKPVEETPKTEIKNLPVVKEKAEVAKKNVVMDMSFLFGEVKTPKTQEKPEEKAINQDENKNKREAPVLIERKQPQKISVSQEKPNETAAKKEETKAVEKTVKSVQKTDGKTELKNVRTMVKKSVQKPLTADEKLRENFLKRMRSLGGDYFEYYSVYLLERYSMKNGRRLEAMRICGGDNDGGVDGEIELTDKFGFKETIYIQAKNWDPEKGDERLWVVGETLLQQFIGACACKQAKEGKQHCRGIFITTSRFTPDAKRILETMSDKLVGYDGEDLYEAAKECEFGLVKKNGEWALDEQLLSGSKAFFHML